MTDLRWEKKNSRPVISAIPVYIVGQRLVLSHKTRTIPGRKDTIANSSLQWQAVLSAVSSGWREDGDIFGPVLLGVRVGSVYVCTM